MLILLDFFCPACDHQWEGLVDSKKREDDCPQCKEAGKQRTTSAIGTVGKPGTPHFQEVMRKRSHDHSVSEAKRNPEALASRIGGRPAAQQKWNIRSHKKSSSMD